MPALGAITFLIHDYDEAIAFFTDALRFELVEDTPQGDGKRWVTVAPRGSNGTRLLLARAINDEQRAHVGKQGGGRVFLFLETDDCQAAYDELSARGVVFNDPPTEQPYGIDTSFRDPSGNNIRLTQVMEFSLDRH